MLFTLSTALGSSLVKDGIPCLIHDGVISAALGVEDGVSLLVSYSAVL